MAVFFLVQFPGILRVSLAFHISCVPSTCFGAALIFHAQVLFYWVLKPPGWNPRSGVLKFTGESLARA